MPPVLAFSLSLGSFEGITVGLFGFGGNSLQPPASAPFISSAGQAHASHHNSYHATSWRAATRPLTPEDVGRIAVALCRQGDGDRELEKFMRMHCTGGT